MQWTESIYLTGYVGVLLVPILARTRAELRRFALDGLLATAVGTFVFVVLPVTAPPRPFEPDGTLGRLLALERGDGMVGGAMPSFHVIWAMLVARAVSAASRRRWVGLLAWFWATAVAVSCVTTGMHALVDIAAGAAVGALVIRRLTVWRALRLAAERVANSWREWRIGPVRVIKHGAYADLAAAAPLRSGIGQPQGWRCSWGSWRGSPRVWTSPNPTAASPAWRDLRLPLLSALRILRA